MMSMSLGPLVLNLDLDSKDPEEIAEMAKGLREEAQTLTPGSDARILLHMIVGFMDGRVKESS